MKNVTLAMEEELIEEGRRYAREHHTSLNAMIRDLLERTIREDREKWVEECCRKMDEADGHSGGRKWGREELYDVSGVPGHQRSRLCV
jgi:ribonuclease D